MATITNQEQFEVWLNGKPREWAVVLAARSALRVLPLIGTWKPKGNQSIDVRNRLILATFRASAAPWVVAKYPTRGADRLASAASASSSRASASAVSSAASRSASDAAASAARSASDASTAAFRSAFDASAAASRSASAAASAARSAAASRASAAASASAIWRSVSADASVLERGDKPATLAAVPLWWEPLPEIIGKAWNNLKADLFAHGADWDVWTNWYEARLVVRRASGKDVDIFRVTLDDAAADGSFPDRTQDDWQEALRAHEADWEKGPAHVNTMIKARMLRVSRSHRSPRVPISAPFQLGPYAQDIEQASNPSSPPTAKAVGKRARKAQAKPVTVVNRALILLQSAAIRDLIDERIHSLETNRGINDFEARDKEIAELKNWRSLADDVAAEIAAPADKLEEKKAVSEGLVVKLKNALGRCIDVNGSQLMASALGGSIFVSFLGIASALDINLQDPAIGLASIVTGGTVIGGPNVVAAYQAVWGQRKLASSATKTPAKPRNK